MSILTFGLGVSGGGTSVFGRELSVELETAPDYDIGLNNEVAVNIDSTPEVGVDIVETIEVEVEPDSDINIDVTCPPN